MRSEMEVFYDPKTMFKSTLNSPGGFNSLRSKRGAKKDRGRGFLACEQQTHFRSSLLSLRKIATTGNASAVRRLADFRF